ncbi:MAG: hypothetical protein ACSHYB_13410 [Roseibacillus sp.]
MRVKFAATIVLMSFALMGAGELLPSDTKLRGEETTEFREIGSFQVTKSVITKLGEATEINKGDLIFRVFTDGIDVRISPEGQNENFLAFQIYYSGDIFDAAGENLSPGVKAISDQGEVVRHIVINAKLLTLTKFPTSTSDVEITYATRYER